MDPNKRYAPDSVAPEVVSDDLTAYPRANSDLDQQRMASPWFGIDIGGYLRVHAQD